VRYQLRMHGFFFDQYLAPAGTIVDDTSSDQWSKMIVARSLHLHPPFNAQPLDQAAYDAMRQMFDASQIITTDPAINRW
jgi:hypothetical protein